MNLEGQLLRRESADHTLCVHGANFLELSGLGPKNVSGVTFAAIHSNGRAFSVVLVGMATPRARDRDNGDAWLNHRCNLRPRRGRQLHLKAMLAKAARIQPEIVRQSPTFWGLLRHRTAVQASAGWAERIQPSAATLRYPRDAVQFHGDPYQGRDAPVLIQFLARCALAASHALPSSVAEPWP